MSTETRKVILTRLSNNASIALNSGKALQTDSKAYLEEYLTDFITLNKKAKENSDEIILLHREVTDLYNTNNNDFTKSSISIIYSVYELLRDENKNKVLMNYIEKHFLENSDKLNLENYKALVRSVKKINDEELINENYDFISKFENLAKVLIPKEEKLPKVIKGGLTFTTKQHSAIKGSIEKVYNVNSELKSITNELKRELQSMKFEGLTKENLSKAMIKLIPTLLESHFSTDEVKEEKTIVTEKVA